MAVQQIIAFVLVAAAAAFLARGFVRALRSFISGKSGCETGCGKCGFAPPDSTSRAPAPGHGESGIIPLADIRSVTRPPDR